MKKKKILVWLLMLSLLLPLPSMKNEVHAGLTLPAPTPPSPPNLEAVANSDPNHSNLLLMWDNGWAPEGWHYQWRLSSNPDMMSFISDESSPRIEYMSSIEFTDELLEFMGNIAYLAVRYVLDGPSELTSEWSNIYSVEINDNGEIINVEPYEESQSQCPNSPSGFHEWNWEEEDSNDYDCTKPYNVRQVCKYCGTKGASKTNPANYLDHHWSNEFVVVFEPTTDREGKGYYSCVHLGCTVRKIEEIPKLAYGAECEHDFQRYAIQEPTCTEPGIAGRRCIKCGAEWVGWREPIPALGHILKRETTRIANCQQTGIIVETCERPGCTYKKTITTPLGDHAWDLSEDPEDYPDDCTKGGKVRLQCIHCGQKSDDLVDYPANPHHYWLKFDLITTKEPSCTEKGEGYYPCAYCKSLYPVDIPMLKHQYEPKTTKQPSCTEAGEKAEVCVNEGCGHIKEGSTEPIDALGHQYERKVKKEPTCTEAGLSSEVCIREGCEYEKPGSEQTIEPLGHRWEVAEVITEASCANKGLILKRCTLCGKEELDIVDQLEHDWVQDEDKDPTCTEWGRLSGHCTICGHTESLDLEPHGHDWIDVKTIREPNCKDPGVKLVRCRICNEEEEQAIPTTDTHDLVEEILVEPTCTEWGKYRVYCKRCGREPVKGDKPPKGHTEVPVDDHKFNCLQGGMVGVTKCSVCGETINKGTWRSAIGHHNWAQKLIEPSTCQKKGSFRRYCTECPAEEIVELPLTEHTWVRGKIYREPDCFTEGWASTECLVCGAMGDPEIFPKTNKHKWITSPKKEPTCTKPGLTESIFCDVCGEYQKRAEIIPPIPHKEVIIHSMRPTSTLEGRTEGKRCGICGVWIVECKPLPKLASERTENNVTEQPPAWPKGSEEPASFKSDADIDDFSHVALNGDMVNESNYDLKEGSTIVIFKPEFLETLPEGKYDVEIVSISSSAFGTLEIVKAEGGYSIPKTGESTGYYLWLALMLLSAGKILLVLRKKKILGQSN